MLTVKEAFKQITNFGSFEGLEQFCKLTEIIRNSNTNSYIDINNLIIILTRKLKNYLEQYKISFDFHIKNSKELKIKQEVRNFFESNLEKCNKVLNLLENMELLRPFVEVE